MGIKGVNRQTHSPSEPPKAGRAAGVCGKTGILFRVMVNLLKCENRHLGRFAKNIRWKFVRFCGGCMRMGGRVLQDYPRSSATAVALYSVAASRSNRMSSVRRGLARKLRVTR